MMIWSERRAMVREAIDIAGRRAPYIWGGNGPDYYDCSGLVCHCLRKAGALGETDLCVMDLWLCTAPVQHPAYGDLVFFGHGPYPSHVGLYLGMGRMVDTHGTSRDRDPDASKAAGHHAMVRDIGVRSDLRGYGRWPTTDEERAAMRGEVARVAARR